MLTAIFVYFLDFRNSLHFHIYINVHEYKSTSSRSLINSPDESYATTGGRHYRIPTRLSPSSNRSKALHLYELDYDKNNDSLSVESNPAIQKSSQRPLSRFTQNKEIIINRTNVGKIFFLSNIPQLCTIRNNCS